MNNFDKKQLNMYIKLLKTESVRPQNVNTLSWAPNCVQYLEEYAKSGDHTEGSMEHNVFIKITSLLYGYFFIKEYTALLELTGLFQMI